MRRGFSERTPGVMLSADLAAWERAEGWGSEAAAAAVARTDAERWIPGLPARRTYKVLGWVVVAAILLDVSLDLAPASALVDMLDGWIRYGTAVAGVAAAAWSLLSEMRGWEGSDAATWFLRGRVKRYEKRLEARRQALRDTAVAVGPEGIVVWRDGGGGPALEVLAPEAILGLALELGQSHMALRLATSDGTRRFGWLPRDPAFEAEVERLAGSVRERGAGVGTPVV